jgi:hypothetical protein
MPFCTIVEFERNTPMTSQMPAPSRVVGFEISSYQTA